MHLSKLPSFPQLQECSLNSFTGPHLQCFWNCLSTASAPAGVLQPPSDPKQDTVAHLGASSVRNSCRLLLWVLYLVVAPGCTPISEATITEGNFVVSYVHLKAQLMGNPPAAVTFDQRKALLVIITNCCSLSFLR